MRADALTNVLQTAALCLAIVVLMCLGAWLDRSTQAEDELAAERQAERVQAVRQAYQQGLDEGAERELFRQARRLAAQEDRR